jgi:hypothetical protein
MKAARSLSVRYPHAKRNRAIRFQSAGAPFRSDEGASSQDDEHPFTSELTVAVSDSV